MPYEDFLKVDNKVNDVFFDVTTSKSVPQAYENTQSVFIDFTENDGVSWSGWTSSLEGYKTINLQEGVDTHRDCLKKNVLHVDFTSDNSICNEVDYIIKDIAKNNISQVGDFLQYINNALKHYNKKITNPNIDCSVADWRASAGSFIEFIRYVPAFYNKPNVKVYIDEKTGFFGLIYKRTSVNSGTLNILVKDNHELEFSFAKRRKGVVTITGVAKFGKDLSNSDQITSLFKLME